MTYSTKKPREFTNVATPTGNEIFPIENASGEGASLKLSDVKKFVSPTPTWRRPQFLNNWTNFGNGYEDLAYCLKDGWVTIFGHIKGGVSGSIVFVLESGFRPQGNIQFFIGGRTTDNKELSGSLNINAATGEVIVAFPLTPALLDVQVTFPVQRNFT